MSLYQRLLPLFRHAEWRACITAPENPIRSQDWLFIQSFFVIVDGQRFDKIYAHFEKSNYTDIWEWYDEPMEEPDRAMIEAIIRSKEATIRFVGLQYHADKKISAAQKAALKNMLDVYDAVSGTK